jgi:alkaline phosphatase D
MTLKRRDFMVGSVGAAAALSLGAGCSDDNGPGNGKPDAGEEFKKPIAELDADAEAFAHGVASGDPSGTSVIIWSRLSGKSSKQTVRWAVASDAELTDVVAEGVETTDAESDYTLKVDVSGLSSGSTYYYAFALGDEGRSVIGRAKTLPAETTHVRFAFTSCANYNNGYFHAYRQIAAREDLDVWIHLGDYVYEYKDGEYGDAALDRKWDPPEEVTTLDAYRKRYGQMRKDVDLQELHRMHTCIVVWDDHEVANDGWLGGAENHSPNEGDWNDRVKAGTRAFVEWLPLRLPDPKDPTRIFRRFEFGKLFDLMMLDTRFYGRDKPAGGLFAPGDPAVWADPKRQLLGEMQEEWLKESLISSRERGATWRFLGNQVMVAETKNPLTSSIANSDAWDGYQPQRARLVSHVKQNGIDNLVVLTGDIHTSWALDLVENPYDPANYDPMTGTGKGSFGVELVGPSVTSLGLEDMPDLARAAPSLLPATNPHLKWVEVTRKGYVLVDVKEERVQAEWYFIADIKKNDEAGRKEELAKAFVCNAGSARLVPA